MTQKRNKRLAPASAVMAQVLQTVARVCIVVLPIKQERNTPSSRSCLGLRNLHPQSAWISSHPEMIAFPRWDRHGHGCACGQTLTWTSWLIHGTLSGHPGLWNDMVKARFFISTKSFAQRQEVGLDIAVPNRGRVGQGGKAKPSLPEIKHFILSSAGTGVVPGRQGNLSLR